MRTDQPAAAGRTPSAVGPWTRRDTWILLGVALVALAVRGVFLWQSRTGPTFYHPVVDADTYHNLAMDLAAGKGLGDGFFWQPFLYPFGLGVFYKITGLIVGGPSILAAKLVQALLGAVTCALTYRLGRMVFGRAVGLIAGGILAFYGPLILYESELLGAGLAAFFAVVLVMAFLRARQSRSWRQFAWLGTLSALAVLTRPTFLPFVGLAGLWLLWTLPGSEDIWRRRAIAAGAALAAFCVPMLVVGWTARGSVGRMAFLPTSGGINLYLGNNPDMDRTLLIRPGWDWENLTNQPRQNGLGPRQEEGYYRDKVLRFARTQPGAFMGGMVRKTLRYVCSREMPRNEDPYMFGRWSSLLGVLMWKAGGFGFPFAVVFPLAVVGLILYGRRIPAVVWMLPVLHGAALVVVFVTARYRVEAAPLLAVLAGCGVMGLVELVRRQRWGTLQFCGVVIGVLAVGGALAGPFPEEQVNFEAELCYDLATQSFRAAQTQLQSGQREAANVNLTKAVELHRRAIELRSDYGDAYSEMGNSLALLGRMNEAVSAYTKALELKPHNAKAYHSLGSVRLAQGDVDEAVRLYQRSLEIYAYNYQTYAKLAEAMERNSRWKEAAAYNAKAAEVVNLEAPRGQFLLKAALDLWRGGQYADALTALESLRERNPRQPHVLLAMAWLRAACPDATFRKGPEALELAEQVMQMVARQPKLAVLAMTGYDVLAAAQAQNGRFDQAVKSGEQALLGTLGKPGAQEKAQRIRQRLELYRAARPYHGSDLPVDLERL